MANGNIDLLVVTFPHCVVIAHQVNTVLKVLWLSGNQISDVQPLADALKVIYTHTHTHTHTHTQTYTHTHTHTVTLACTHRLPK